LLSCRLSLATPLGPRIAPRRAPPHGDIYEKGDSPLFQRVNSQYVTHDDPLYIDFYTGERLAMCGTASGGEASRIAT